MLKKVFSSKSLNHVQDKQGDVQCLVCKSYSNTIIYVCESGRYLCKTCKSIDNDGYQLEKPRNKSLVCGGQCDSLANCSGKNVKLFKESEFASGDSTKINNNRGTLQLENQERTFKNTQHTHNVGRDNYDDNDKNIKAIIKYNNNDYKESTSSINSISMNIVNSKDEELYKNAEAGKILTRPVVCPVTSCGKMLAIDSTLQHFCFDHSKVPKILLKPRKSQRLVTKPCVFTKDTQCIAVIAHQYYPSELWTQDPSDILHTKCSHLLLMCAMTSQAAAGNADKNIIHKHAKEMVQPKTKNNGPNISLDGNNTTNKVFNNDESLLMWLCRTDCNANSYKITLSRKDKLLSYTFTGEATHVKDNQDATAIYERSNCLIVKGSAANRLLDEHNQLHIYISNI